MMPLASRRGLLLAAVTGAAVRFGRRAPSFGFGPAGAGSALHHQALATVCAEFGHAAGIGKACLRALPVHETSRQPVTRAILADLAMTGPYPVSPRTVARAIRQRSRDDFASGRIVSVDGWMLSLTEARVYALAALPTPAGHAAG